MARIKIREAHVPASGPDGSVLLTPLGTLAFLLLLGRLPGASFRGLVVFPLTAVFCGALWFVGRRSGKGFLLGVLLYLAGLGLLVWRLFPRLSEELAALLGRTLEFEDDPWGMTALTVTASAALSFLLFLLETVLHAHGTTALLVGTALLLTPFSGMELSAAVFFVPALFLTVSLALSGAGRGGGRLPTALLACAFGALAFLAAVPIANAQSERVFDAVDRAEAFVTRTVARVMGSHRTGVQSGTIARGNLYPTGTVHLTVLADREPTEPVYLRGFTGGEYVGSAWARDDGTGRNLPGWDDGDFFRGGIYYDLNLYTARDAENSSTTLVISHENGDYNSLYEPYYSSLRSTANLSYASDAYSDSFVTLEGPYSYRRFEQKDMHIDWDAIRGSMTDSQGISLAYYQVQREVYARAAQEAYTRVPVELVPRLAKLVSENPLSDLNDITAFILYTLHSQCTYSLTPGRAPAGEDIVEHFLFERQKGYCQHFAAAATLLYRLYGVPARYVTGYCVDPGEFQADEGYSYTFASPHSSSMTAVRYTCKAQVTDGDAHAWVEIFLSDYGWTPVEVTPASNGETVARYPGFDSDVYNRLTERHGWDSVSSPRKPSGGGFLSSRDGSDSAKIVVPLLVTASVLTFALVLTFVLRARRRRAKRRAKSCRAVFERLLSLLRCCGRLPEGDGTEPDFAERLGRAVPGLAAEDAEALMDSVRAEAFGPPGAPSDVSAARKVYRKALQALRPELPPWKRVFFRNVKTF